MRKYGKIPKDMNYKLVYRLWTLNIKGIAVT